MIARDVKIFGWIRPILKTLQENSGKRNENRIYYQD
jgi:hypothetical protein